MTNRLASRTLAVCVAAACVLALALPASALTINVTFKSSSSDSPSFDPNGLLLAPIMEQAAAFWSDIIEDTGTLDIEYYYDDLSDPNVTLGLHNNLDTSGGKPTRARIRFDTELNGVERDWWFDPTPAENSEFNLTQSLYRDLSPAQQTAWFNGSPPEVLEVGYRGSAVNGGAADGHNDIFSTAIHEMGHALGLTSAVAETETADGDYDVLGVLVHNTNTDILEHAPDNYHIASRLSLMCSGCGSSSLRRLPTATDAFAAAAAAGWTEIDLPRQDFWGGTNWSTAFNWEGNQVPGAADDAYVRLQGSDPTVSLSAGASVGSLFVGEGDNVRTQTHKLKVYHTATIDGTDSDIIVPAGGELEADEVVIQNDGELFITGGLVDANEVTTDNGGTVTANTSTGTVDVLTKLYNDGTVQATNDGRLVFTTSGGSVWDLDGGGDGIVQATDGDIEFNGGATTDAFDGDIIIGPGHHVTIESAWTLGTGGVIDFNGGSEPADAARLIGGLISATRGDIEATGDARIISDINLGGTVDVVVPGVNDSLSLYGKTTYSGGSYTGLGTIYQVTEASVSDDTTIDVATFDWDGGSGTSKTTIVGATLTINSGKIDTSSASGDGHDGEVTVFGGALEVNTTDPWRMDGKMTLVSGVVRGQDLRVFGELAANPFLSGTSNTIEADVTFEPGSTIAVGNNTTLTLRGATTYNGTTASGTGTLVQKGSATVTADTTIDTAVFDWDGPGLIIILPTPPAGDADDAGDAEGTFGFSSTTIAAGRTLTINSDKIDTGVASADGYDGTVSLASGATLAVNTSGPWRLDGTLNMNHGGAIPRVIGSQMVVYGHVNVTGGTARIYAPVDFKSTANVTVPTELGLDGVTTFNGGTYTGVGQLRQSGDATVESPTTIAVDTYDMDGLQGVFAKMTLNDALTLNVNHVEVGSEEYNGTLTINNPGELTVNTPGPWEMAGTLNLNQNGLNNRFMVKGSDVNVSGQVNVTGAAAFGATVHLTGTITLGDAGDFLQLGNNNAHTIAGGQIVGPGRLTPGSGSLTGFGEISADLDSGSGDLWADDGTLVFSGAIVNVDKIGTADSDGRLVVTNAWNTSATNLVELNGGVLTGATIGNVSTGVIRGHGTIAATQLNNDGLLAAQGGTLTIDTTNDPNLDGFSTVTGGIEAVGGNLVVVSPLADPFDNVLTVGQTRTATFKSGWALGVNGTLNLNGGTISSKRAMVTGGAQVLGGRVNVAGLGHFKAQTTFNPTAAVDLPLASDALHILSGAGVYEGATFTGDGTLVNASGSTLAIEDGQGMGTLIHNAGTLDVGFLPAPAKIGLMRGAALGPASTLRVDTKQNHLDLVVAPDGVVDIDSGASLEINIYGGGDEFRSGTYTVIDASGGGSVAGVFTNVTDLNAYVSAGPAGNGLTYTGDTVTLTLDLNLHPGDANLDGATDVSDRIIWNSYNFTEGTTFQTGDFNNDGATDVSDRIIWNAYNFTEATAGAIFPAEAWADSDGQMTVVPEPTCMALLALGSLAMLRRKRRA